MRSWVYTMVPFEVPDMEADGGETPDDSMAQVTRVKATPRPTFEQTCHDVGAGRFTHDQLAEVVQLASLHSETLSQTTVV